MIKIVHEKFRISIQFLIFKEFLFSDFNADFLFEMNYTENHCLDGDGVAYCTEYVTGFAIATCGWSPSIRLMLKRD